VVVAAALGVGSAVGFTTTRPSRRWRGERHEAGWLGPFSAPGMRTVFAVLAVFGTAVGIVQVAVPAFADDRGSAAVGGVLLAALSAGSLVGGLVYGARPWPGSLPRRLGVLMIGLGAAFALLSVAGTEVALAALLVLAGLLFAPTTVVASTLLDSIAPSGTVTEAFTVLVMAIVVGTAIGNAVGGSIVDGASFDAAVLWAGVAALAGAAVALLRRRTLSARTAA
jgi:MFS family permease